MKFLDLFTGWRNTADFASGSIIFSESDSAEDIFIVLAGEVELTLHGKSLGRETAGGIIGEMAIIDSRTRNSTATAKTDVTLARLTKGQIRELVDMSSEFSFHAMATLANRLRAVDRYISDHIEQ